MDTKKPPTYDLETLLAKGKDELERIKLAREIHSDPERKRYWRETWRLLFIAISGGAISAITGAFLEHGKERTNERQEFEKHETACHTKDDKALRLDCLCNMKSRDMPYEGKEAEERLIRYEQSCADKVAYEQSLAELNMATKPVQVQDRARIAEEKDSVIHVLKQELAQAPEGSDRYERINDSLRLAVGDLARIIRATPALSNAITKMEAFDRKDSAVSVRLNALMPAVAPVPDGSVTHSSETMWFKENYYLNYRSIRVVLINLGEKEITVRVKTNDAAASTILGKVLVRLGQSAEVPGPEGTGERYRIYLESIRHAGNNPFKKAAYVRFETIK